MKARFDAGTDVAMIGAWDAQRGLQPFSADEVKRLSEALDAEASAGHLFVAHTGGDGGGPVDVYIDEPIPEPILAGLTPIGDACILALPSGTLLVDGVEQYRAKKPEVARTNAAAVALAPGDYALRCWVTKDEEGEAPQRPHRDLEAIVGADELRYYERTTRLGCLAAPVLLLLFPLLLPFLGWKIATVITLVGVVAFFNIREWLLRRNPRFTRLRQAVTAFRLGHTEATLVMELRRVESRADRA